MISLLCIYSVLREAGLRAAAGSAKSAGAEGSIWLVAGEVTRPTLVMDSTSQSIVLMALASSSLLPQDFVANVVWGMILKDLNCT